MKVNKALFTIASSLASELLHVEHNLAIAPHTTQAPDCSATGTSPSLQLKGISKMLKTFIMFSLSTIGTLVACGTAHADTITDSSGVKYTLTSDFLNEGTIASPEYDVMLVINSSSLPGDTLIAVAPQFQLNGGGIASGVTIDSVTSGTWSSPLTPGSTNSSGCMGGGAAAGFFCTSGSAAAGGTITFVFDVSTPAGGTLSTSSDIKAVFFDSTGKLADQTSQGITIQQGTTPPPVPEPSSLSLLGLGLSGLARLSFLARRRRSVVKSV